MSLGYDKSLYFLPFDHRGSFKTGLFGWNGELRSEQIRRVSEAKQVIYDAFQVAVANGVHAERAGILVDEQFGASILRAAKSEGFVTAAPAEKSGQREFDFEYGDDFAEHIEAVAPTFCKVLVRYNPAGDPLLNRRQATRLKHLSDYLRARGRSQFLFELLVPPEPLQLEKYKGDKKAFDRELRPQLMVETIRELQDAHVEPDVWKIEGLDRREDCRAIVAAARRDGRDKVGCIVLGRGENEEKVSEWLTTAASVPGFTGFAVGRTAFWEPLIEWRDGKLPRAAAVQEISLRYQGFVDIFESGRATAARYE